MLKALARHLFRERPIWAPENAEQFNEWAFIASTQKPSKFLTDKNVSGISWHCASCKTPRQDKPSATHTEVCGECGLHFRRWPVMVEGFCDEVYVWR